MGMYGAIVATFALYTDFMAYKGGVYRGQQIDESYRLGMHVVQLLGWGLTNSGGKYWIAENSWGSSWGENQYFQPCSVTDCKGPFSKHPTASDRTAQTQPYGRMSSEMAVPGMATMTEDARYIRILGS